MIPRTFTIIYSEVATWGRYTLPRHMGHMATTTIVGQCQSTGLKSQCGPDRCTGPLVKWNQIKPLCLPFTIKHGNGRYTIFIGDVPIETLISSGFYLKLSLEHHVPSQKMPWLPWLSPWPVSASVAGSTLVAVRLSPISAIFSRSGDFKISLKMQETHAANVRKLKHYQNLLNDLWFK